MARILIPPLVQDFNFHTNIKSDHVLANIFDVDPDAEIYKIMQFKYFSGDLRNDYLTHMFPSKETWGDPYENLLLNQGFKDSLTGEALYLTGIVDDLYATCWTLEKNESIDHWSNFSRKNPAVRIKSTPRKLLSSLMNTNDVFFSLHHYIGKVLYEEVTDLCNFFSDPDWQKHLDSQGQGAALSLMRLQEDLSVHSALSRSNSFHSASVTSAGRASVHHMSHMQ